MGSRRTKSWTAHWESLTRPFSPKGPLSAITLTAFCILSAIATAIGFIDLRAAGTEAGRLGAFDMSTSIALSVFVICAMVVALHHVVAPRSNWWSGIWVRAVALVFYLLFAVWSVGFGFGFFWKELAGREFTRTQFTAVSGDISRSMAMASSALGAAETAVLEAATLARERAAIEAREGRTCANRPNSTPGDGPLTRSRFQFAERAESVATDVRRTWIAPVSVERERMTRRVDALSGQVLMQGGEIGVDEAFMLERLRTAETLSVADRRDVFGRMHRDAVAFAGEANGLRALHAETYAGRLAALSREVGPDPARPGSPDPARADDAGYCWDVVLSAKLDEAAQRLRSIETVSPPDFQFLEGPHATRAAFFALIGQIQSALGLGEPEGGEGAIPFGQKALLALFASLMVDLGIFFLTILRAVKDTPVRERGAPGRGEPRPPDLEWVAGG